MKLIFLGTGGGRHMMITQTRKTGGLFFDLDKIKFVLDPGPGSIVYAIGLGLQPEKFNGVVLSHLHVDHATDANAYLDGIKDPFIIAEEHCLLNKRQTKADFDYYPCINPYHQKLAEVHPVKHGDEVTISGIKFAAVKSDHYDPTVGFRITSPYIDIGYTADGAYYKGMEKHYDGCKLLIVNTIIPKGEVGKRRGYMSVNGVISLLSNMKNKPSLVVLNHMSFWMLRSNLWKQEKIIQDATKVKTIHSEDFMTIDLKTLAVAKHREGKSAKVTEFVDNV